MSFVKNANVLIVILVLCQSGIGVRIQITPNEYDGTLANTFEVKCLPEGANNYANRIVVVQLSRNGEKPLVTLHQNGDITYARLLEISMTAVGHIDDVPEESYLNITFSNAMKEDSGQYVCSVFYLDESGHMKEDRSSANFLVQHQAMKDIVRFLTAKVTTLERMLGSMEGKLAKQLQVMRQKDKNLPAFMAGFNADEDAIMKNHVVRFRNVVTRIGGGYNEGSGIFTAPQEGLYAFNLFAWSGSTKGFYIEIQANNKTEARLYSGNRNHEDQSSVNCVVHLKAGDKVQCVSTVIDSGASLKQYPQSAFSGYLIRPL